MLHCAGQARGGRTRGQQEERPTAEHFIFRNAAMPTCGIAGDAANLPSKGGRRFGFRPAASPSPCATYPLLEPKAARSKRPQEVEQVLFFPLRLAVEVRDHRIGFGGISISATAAVVLLNRDQQVGGPSVMK